MKYTYLGPAGTFCEQALLTLPGPAAEPEHNRIPATNVDVALQLVRDDEVDAAVVPIENSVEGGVSATLDAIAAGDSLHIVAEAVIPVTFQLAALPGIESLEGSELSQPTATRGPTAGTGHKTRSRMSISCPHHQPRRARSGCLKRTRRIRQRSARRW